MANNGILKPFTHCWLHTINDDWYVGRIINNRFVGKKLTVTIEPIIVIASDQSGRGWHPTAQQPKCTSETFEFEDCNLIRRWNERKIEYQSSMQDKIILSSDKLDEGIIESIIGEVVT